MADSPRQSIAYQQLDRFAGTWDTSGVLTDTTSGIAQVIEGTDRYEWLEGGYFLIHTVNVRIGDTHKTAIEIIGFDVEKSCYTMDSYDNGGGIGKMFASVKGRNWHFWSDALQFLGAFNETYKKIHGIWQTNLNGKWTELMTIRLEKK